MQRKLKACNLALNEAVDLAQNRPEADVYAWRYAHPVVHARKEEEE